MSIKIISANNECLFVFETMDGVIPNFRSRIKSMLGISMPCFFGSVICVSYGIMLGWPSPTYPKLLQVDSPVLITIDQSAMIAGFLMLGMVASTPFSSWSFLGTKYGIVVGYVLVSSGWACMWVANNIYWLLGSRFLIGAGHGYGSGQLKIYIKDLCGFEFSAQFNRITNLLVYFGVIVAYVMGPFVSFEQFSLVSLSLTLTFLGLTLFIPHTPKELCYLGKYKHAKQLLKLLKPTLNSDNELERIKSELTMKTDEMSFFGVIKNSLLRGRFFVLVFLIFFQQFTGAPATVVYAQMIFTKSKCPHPEICAIIYGTFFFISNTIGVLYTSRAKNKKLCLLTSNLCVIVALILKILVVYFDFGRFWSYASFIVMIFFIVTHSVGLAIIPFTYIDEFFPKSAKKVLVHYYIMSFCALALIITKIFQVLYDRFPFYVPFSLFLCVGFVSLFFIMIFVPNKTLEVSND